MAGVIIVLVGHVTKEGALAGLDAVFGIHVDPTKDVGVIATRSGPLMAAADEFDLTVRGYGGHAARPQAANDPIVLAAHVIQAIHQIVSRRLNPLETTTTAMRAELRWC